MCSFEFQSFVGVRTIGSSVLDVLLEAVQDGEYATESHVVRKLGNRQFNRGDLFKFTESLGSFLCELLDKMSDHE